MALGERIKQARLASGMSLRALASEVGVSAQAISKYERGLDVPSSGVLIRLAQALDIKVEFFFRPTHATVTGLAYRKHSSLGAKNQKAIQARVQEWLDRYLEIESIFPSDINAFALPTNINRHPESMDDVEQTALSLRKEWGVGLGPIDNMIDLLEAWGIKVGLIEGASGFDACTFLIDEGSPVIGVKRDLPGDRQRFSLAHELGHIILEPEGTLNIEEVVDRFAGAFLVPAPTVRYELGNKRKELTLYELHVLKHKYGLSMQGWIHRAEDVGIISGLTAKRLRHWFKDCGWTKDEPGDHLAPEISWHMESLILRAVTENIISETRASELLGKSLEEFWREIKEKHKGLPVVASI